MATSQKFDALDGIEVTGEIIAGANLAIDTNVLFVDAVNNRVGINKTPASNFDVNGSATVSTTLTLGSDIIHSGDADTKISFTTNQIDFTAGNSNNLRINQTDVSVDAGTGLTIRGVSSANSEFQTNSNKADGSIGANFVYTSFIEASTEKASGSTGIAIGEITYEGDGTWGGNLADQIKFVLAGGSTGYFDSSGLRLNSKLIDGVSTITIASNLVHDGDTNTSFGFPGNDRAEIRTGGTQRLEANNSGVYVTGTLDVSTDIVARRIRAEDYFIETKITATTGTGTKTYDLNSGSSFEHTASGNFTANFTNVPTTNTLSWTIRVVNDGTARIITWQAGGTDSIKWAEGVIPPPSTGIDIYSFISIAGEIYGSLAVRNAS